MSSVQYVNSRAEVVRKNQALVFNTTASKGLEDILKSNLGPRGTLKMLVSGAGDIKLTKDGNVLLHEMQIQHPTAQLIARTATAQDDTTGDGTTTTVLLIGEIMKLAERQIVEDVHARVLSEGIEKAKEMTLQFLDSFKKAADPNDRELLLNVARSSLTTKVRESIAFHLSDIVVDAVLCVRKENQPVDLHMVEIMHMEHRTDMETRFVNGLVLDHGSRHPDMPKKLKNCYILTCNVSLEYEKSEFNSSFVFKSAEEREKLVESERKFTDEKVKKIIELKKLVCDGKDKSFVVINQKGVDPMSLDMFAKEGIIALRRAKRRNMERLTLACGGTAVNSVEELTPDVLGYAGEVHEEVLGDEKYTFVEDVRNPKSCTILIKGPNKHTIAQVKDAVRDGLRAVKNVVEDKYIVPGAGAFEVAAYLNLRERVKEVSGKTRLGVELFGQSLLVVPKTLASNSGFDPQESIIKLQEEHEKKNPVGLDIMTGECMDPEIFGVLDCFRVKKQMIESSAVVSAQLLLVDEIMRAGRNAGRT